MQVTYAYFLSSQCEIVLLILNRKRYPSSFLGSYILFKHQALISLRIFVDTRKVHPGHAHSTLLLRAFPSHPGISEYHIHIMYTHVYGTMRARC